MGDFVFPSLPVVRLILSQQSNFQRNLSICLMKGGLKGVDGGDCEGKIGLAEYFQLHLLKLGLMDTGNCAPTFLRRNSSLSPLT